MDEELRAILRQILARIEAIERRLAALDPNNPYPRYMPGWKPKDRWIHSPKDDDDDEDDFPGPFME